MTADATTRQTLNDNSGGFLKLLGIVIDEADAERVVLSMEVTPDHLQPHGVTHGGVYCTLVETAASVGGHLWLEREMPGNSVVGVANNTDFLRPSSGGRLVATATPVHRGKSQQLWQVEITDAGSKLLARGQVRLHNIRIA